MMLQWLPGKLRGFRLPPLRRVNRANPVPIAFAPLLQALLRRSKEGELTTLRDLHKLTGNTQPEALQMLQALEQRGLVRVEHSSQDRFASKVTLTENAIALLMVSQAA